MMMSNSRQKSAAENNKHTPLRDDQIRFDGDNGKQKGGVLRVLAFVVLAIILSGGYVLWINNFIPEVHGSFMAAWFDKDDATVSAPSISHGQEVPPQTVSEVESSSLPEPRIDVQSAIDFASFNLSSAVVLAPADNKEDYVVSPHILADDDILPEQVEEVDFIVDKNGGDEVMVVDEKNEDTIAIVRTAAASRAHKKMIDALTATEEIINNGVIIHSPTSEPRGTVAEIQKQITETRPRAKDNTAAEINILPSEDGMTRQKLLQQAMSLYVDGLYTEAETLYRSVLVKNPTNITALHGLALVAVASGRYQLAVATHLRVLEHYPANPISLADLTNLTNGHGAGGQNFYETESALKKLLGQRPEWDSRLYFTLGNLYATHGRWLAAQKSYFAAHTREQNNPDYAYNLAVVLDYLHKKKLAVDYYQKALELATQSPSGFATAPVRARIDLLRN